MTLRRATGTALAVICKLHRLTALITVIEISLCNMIRKRAEDLEDDVVHKTGYGDTTK